MRSLKLSLAIASMSFVTTIAYSLQYHVYEQSAIESTFHGDRLDEHGYVYGIRRVGSVWGPARWNPGVGYDTWEPISGYDFTSFDAVSEPSGMLMGVVGSNWGFIGSKILRWTPSGGYTFQDYATGSTPRGIEFRNGNDSGTIVGQEYNIDQGYYYGNAIYYADGTTESQPEGGYLVDIANDGTIIGDVGGDAAGIRMRTPDHVWHALERPANSYHVLAEDINEVGQIVGRATIQDNGPGGYSWQTVLYQSGIPGVRLIPNTRRYTGLSSVRMNDSGMIVSSYLYPDAPGQPFHFQAEIWTEADGPRLLESLLDTESTTLGYHDFRAVYGLNNRGEMIASAKRGTSPEEVWVYLRPVPEPTSLLALSVGPLVLLYRKRRP